MKELFILAAAYALWNLIVFFVYGIDKRKAKKNRWRISEGTLIALAFFMGGIGAAFGMRVFRHKTKHLKFRICVPLSVIFNLAVIAWVTYVLLTVM